MIDSEFRKNILISMAASIMASFLDSAKKMFYALKRFLSLTKIYVDSGKKDSGI